MKLTNRKIKKLIRESLKRILFESEDRIANLKDQFNLVYQKMSRAKTQEEFDQLSAEAERLDKEINRLTRTMFKEPEEPGEFDFMETEPLQPPMLSRGTEVGAFQDDIDPLDRPAILDVDEVDMYPGGPMTQREKNRRDFIRDSVLGSAGVAYTLGKAVQHSSVDPRLKIASDWFDQSFTDGTWQKMYDYNFKTWTDNALQNVGKDFISMTRDEQLEYILTYFMDYNPEGWGEALGAEFEMLGYQDPGETDEMDVYYQLDELIRQKIKNHYTPEKIKQLRGR